MSQQAQDFSYGETFSARDSAGLPATVAIFADRPGLRDRVFKDLSGAGFRAVDGGSVSKLIGGQITVLGDVVLLDCPDVDAETMAALHRLDMRVARTGSQLIVSTTLDALDAVFSAFNQSDPQILVNPSRADRVVAVGRVLGTVSNGRVREMTEADRLTLLRLSQQVDAIAQRIEGLGSGAGQSGFAGPVGLDNQGEARTGGKGSFNTAKHPLPDPRVVRQIIANRQARARFFDDELFADPAWDMLLDLTAAHAEHQRVSVTSLCIAAGVPPTTALRWVRQMVDCGIFVRIADSTDKRRAFVALSEQSVDAMARYFAHIEQPLAAAA